MTRPAGPELADLCAVVLAAGAGTRLRPLTGLRPKALCPVGNQPMLDRVRGMVAELGLTGPERVAVNACWLGEQIAAHVGDSAYVSMEAEPLGTAGGVANLRDWIAGRPVLVGNADAYLSGAGLAALLSGWDGERVRLLGVPAPPGLVDAFGADRFAGFSLLPWRLVRDLPAGPGELVSAIWRPAEAAGALEVIRYPGCFVDIGTPAGYLRANRHAAAVATGATGGVASGAGATDGVASGAGATGGVISGAGATGGVISGARATDGVASGAGATDGTAQLAPQGGAADRTAESAPQSGTAGSTPISGTAGTAPISGGAGPGTAAGGVVGSVTANPGTLIAPDAVVTGTCRESVVGAGARVYGRLTRSVVWPGGYVGPTEHLVDAIRVGADLTVHAAV